jgi:hypothetical protein
MAKGTIDIGIHPFTYKDNRTIYLLDTPGFDDTTRSDTQVLKELATFLGATYSKDIKLAGIIYLHRITDNRIGGHALRNLAMFQKLCGKESLANVVLATTMWDKLKDVDAVQAARDAETQLIENPKWRGDMIDEGSKVFRQNDGLNSALDKPSSHRIL